MSKTGIRIVFVQAVIAMLGSLYYGWFGDPAVNAVTGEWFVWSNGLRPCELCRFARVLMYPIVIIGLLGLIRGTVDRLLVLVLSGLGVMLESYQYRYQMTHSSAEVQSAICGVEPGASCAATDVIYFGFVTIPFLCLVAFIVIFIAAWQYRQTDR